MYRSAVAVDVHQAEFKASFVLSDGRWVEVESSEGEISVIDPRLDDVTDPRQAVPEAALAAMSAAVMTFMHACGRWVDAKVESES